MCKTVSDLSSGASRIFPCIIKSRVDDKTSFITAMSSQLLPSALLNDCLFFTNTYLRNQNRTQRVNKLIVFAAVSLSTQERNGKHRGYAIKTEEGGEESLEFKENPRSLRAQRFVDAIKGLPLKERSHGISNKVEKDGGNWSLSDFNDLLMALVTLNELDTALKFYDEMSSSYGLVPNYWTFSIMVRCHCKKNDFVEARKVIDYMIDKRFYPNVTTCTIVIDSMCKCGMLKEAFEVFEVMGRISCERSIQTYNCLLKGLCYVGRVEEAYDMLMNVKKDLKPDIYSYTAVMDGFCKVGRSKEAMALLYEAIEMGLTPGAVTFNTLFNGYCKEGRPMAGFRVLQIMKKRNCMPDNISYSTLLNGLLKWGKIRPALSTFKEMVKLGFEVDERMINALLRGLCVKSWKEKDLLEDAYQLFEKMSDRVSVMYPSTCGLVIRALSLGNKPEEAFIYLHRLIEMGHIPRTITFNNVIHALSSQGNIDKVLLVLFLMYEHGRIPSRTSYDILIKKLDRLEKSSIACIVYGVALKQGVNPHRKPRYLAFRKTCSTAIVI